ncbi:hypothetical protein EN858_11260 [Mesorhizobium sp. M4B.F.Ca.ET.215.01.1.1]|uniref:hypothetical protein n=1 Tax=unclassified Mesorhizobium TaxID=325217 RepID=UPI000FCA4B58|nr:MULTISPECIES: hypothetical protein [unclassified Mesorhizobium]RVD42947.1 hypothetical protein EN741_10955 [Mesorhizobium sp. M4B.F.Ca.ET.019.03.1.1]RWF65820.1 MAG: hypothetical protein EOS47_08665 [Mesorhizobium sp.]TGQ12992.1 hypothetical protein EN858_11260 [Mesorhizobium sp. M4B.F.Ca.ET.215.01.1.1]TGQ43306.1 hypothetical protein EN857_04110 [Mesorhizobium sp. M4B.F.Ca.ET.214.01.1.1]TGQ46389.1 hypothetical protein EN863_011460 [Mesorhizobium sp. M00.F.Ca.ET.220.01.1.1]
MSDNYLRLVSYDPRWRPGEAAAREAVTILRDLFPRAEHIGVEFEKGVTFFDAGANTESINCPLCGSDLEDWWGEAMDRAASSGFEDLAAVTPCCHGPTSLNDLRYVWPAAFGSCALTVVNPDETSLETNQLRRIEQAIGSQLKAIWQHL